MQTTVAEDAKNVDIADQRAGLGLERFPTACGAAWGHNGVIPGYVTYAFSSRDGYRQTVLTVNKDASALSNQAATRFFRTLTHAYCRTRT